MKRRTFLYRIGSILAALGVSEADWLTLGNAYGGQSLRYYQALADPNPRKLALLVGINQYPKNPALSGCLTDVELQRELLIHRFGFQSSDILTLTEEQASREFIEAAFLEHLGKQIKPGDVVIFHFSGYGTRIKSPTLADSFQNALISANEQIDQQGEKIVNYLLEDTLLLLLRSLPTDRVTAVLDTSYYAPSTIQPSGWRIRSRPDISAQLTAAELDFQQQLKSQLATKNAIGNAILLAATSDPKQLAREVLFSGFSAGLFTYALTQYLWEASPATTIQVILSHVASSIYKVGSTQQPALLSGKKNPQETLLAEFLLPNNTIGAEGVVTAIEEDGKTVELWLAGLPPQVLEYYGINSRLTLDTHEQLVVRSRTGLKAKALISSLDHTTLPQVGQLVQEAVRVLPRNIGLTVALDTKLERIERVDATSAFATATHVSTVVAGEQPSDYVFGKLLPTPSRYGLFSVSGELIPNMVGEAGEAVKVAVQSLAPKLPTLLAAKLWRLTENEGSSRLAVRGTLEIISGISRRVVMQRETVRTLKAEGQSNISYRNQPGTVPIVPIGSRVQYRVQNLGDRPVYLILVGLRNSRSAIALYPWQIIPQTSISEPKPPLQQIVIAPGATLAIPQTATTAGWVIPGPAFFCEHQLILSTNPFSGTLTALETSINRTADQQPISPLLNPLEVAQALLQDLHNASAVKAEMNGTAADSYILDVNSWASLNFSFQVV
ncbi:caspase family protein [Calothrix sp. PCC 7507]|uniref:caspase family protein n=1 Tax=Calothrix sp. PCC 7507 TaxID=99598 RepID=UPI00029F25CC|nr:caspase family protein [Calothrix sp. PCC 7507]AFY33242.1 peptidase C14 caspase catalytic subunit p20 [Calothrix sp. PCC 7507]